MNINELVIEAYKNACEKGWHDIARSPLEAHALIHSEIGEATEAAREDRPPIYQFYDSSDDADFIMLLEITGGTCLVDLRDYERLSDYSWYLSSDGNSTYLKANHGGSSVSFHNLVVNPPNGKVIDHIDGNTLNNLRSNLRICTPSQNQANQCLQKVKKSSKFKGVYYNETKKKWISQIGFEGKRIYIGTFDSEYQAAMSYDEKAIFYFGQYARTNFLQPIRPEIIVSRYDLRWNDSSKCEGEAIELADAVIRIADYFGERGWDLEQAIKLKMAYNKTRPHRHGNKKY